MAQILKGAPVAAAITEKLAQEELSIPIGPTISLEEAAEVVSLINRF